MVKQALIALISISFFCYQSYAQADRHKFWIYEIGPRKMGLEEILKQGTPRMSYDSLHCEVQWALFYFTVNSKGQIKELEVDEIGGLDSSIVNKVKKNIYDTQGRWNIPEGTLPNEECKFIYPYFRSGFSVLGCTQEEVKEKWLPLKFVRFFHRLRSELDKEKGHVYVISPRMDAPGQH
jgi:hypothetical protein